MIDISKNVVARSSVNRSVIPAQAGTYFSLAPYCNGLIGSRLRGNDTSVDTASRNDVLGFTLIEILIALFIFTILSVLMMGGLRTVINIQSRVEDNSAKLHQLQIALLIISHDIEQAVDRPITNAFGNVDASFIGAANGFTLTHMGLANPMGNIARSVMQRVRYNGGGTFVRSTWEVLDQAPQSHPVSRALLKNVNEVSFKYLGADGRFYNTWPVIEQANQPLPRAIRIFLSLPNWGKMSQLYVIPAQPSLIPTPPTPPVA